MTVTLALPSKGRLKEQALEGLAKAGLAVSLPEDERKYHARIEACPGVEVAFLSASEIAGEIGSGTVDLGVTGEDLVRENLADWEARAEIAVRLGFGHADVVVAVPEIWLDVDTMAESLGATEGAPAAGSADIVVDITSSGSTLRANHLKVLSDGVILRSQACLVAARKERSPADEARVAEIVEKVSKTVG